MGTRKEKRKVLYLSKSIIYLCCLVSHICTKAGHIVASPPGLFFVQRFKLLYISFWPHGFTVIKAISDLDIFKFIDSKSSRYV